MKRHYYNILKFILLELTLDNFSQSRINFHFIFLRIQSLHSRVYITRNACDLFSCILWKCEDDRKSFRNRVVTQRGKAFNPTGNRLNFAHMVGNQRVSYSKRRG